MSYNTNLVSTLKAYRSSDYTIPSSRRQLSAAVNNGNIKGTLVVGDITDKETYQFDHFLKVNGTGLPSNCTDDCAMAIGLAESRDCGEDIHDSASKVLLPKDLLVVRLSMHYHEYPPHNHVIQPTQWPWHNHQCNWMVALSH